MSSISPSSSITSAGSAGELTIASWPLRDEPVWSAGILVFIGLVSALCGWGGQSGAMGAVAAGALLIATWKQWVPARFQLGPRGVAVTYLGGTRQLSWTNVARYQVRRRGVLLYPIFEQNVLAGLRGLYVPFGGQRDKVLALVERFAIRVAGPHDSTVTQRAVK